ncbi:bifunctional 5,10-methylenetetrahydrofolate dehydrogenase/5,10-methenyltetrahydrofolate cyclohydrolase, partial [Candidatus Roizmanbacteria bacterium]|nr:bifunctional 5,10-methylenetetrahydrofolate dehydrogenase/5,10-methenyltetrahydrofolate cyclohydrolase [Candidatus Roizmanbacteria bacterium]
MELPGKKIALMMQKLLKKEIKRLKKKKKLKLTTFLVGDSADQRSFVRSKAKVAKKLGILFELVHMKTAPSFETFMHKLREKSDDPSVTGIIIQQPLPAQLSTSSIYDYIPDKKEIEAHKRKSPFLPPIGLAVLTTLSYFFTEEKLSEKLITNLLKDRISFKRIFRNKKVVLVGRGVTGGQPIGKTLNDAKVNYINVNSQTPDAHLYFKEADVIITAVGKKVIKPEDLKPGVALINVGLRREKGNLKGDYDEHEVKDIAGFYTPTPGGVGPIDVLYLFKNLIDSALM